MKLTEFIKLLLKHKVILMVLPLIMGVLAILLTINPNHKYYSQTMLFTGLASGSSIDMDKSFNYFATNIAFDNLINIINSRETQEEVAVRLLSQHLLLNAPNERFISKNNYENLKEDVPQELYKYIVKSNDYHTSSNLRKDSLSITLPSTIHVEDYEQTVVKLLELMRSDNNNFVYSLLNFEHPIYSLEAIAKVKAIRVSNSDLVKMSFEAEDPGICQQTLAIFNEVCIRKYKDLKENGSDAVVQYFEAQLAQSHKKLRTIEDRLLKFNQENSIINYYEQSKAVAIVKEDMEVEYNRKTAELAGSQASTMKLEQKLEIQEAVQQRSNQIIENKKRLGDLNYKIVMMEAMTSDSEAHTLKLEDLKNQASNLNLKIESSVSELYSFQNTVEGVPITKVLPQWVDKVVETEDLRAKLVVMDKRNEAFEKKYANYAPAGANLKRIEREIEVAEQEYLEILHGLNLAKLKFQDTQLSSNLKAVDAPYYPLKPIPSKRKLIILAAIIMAFIIILGSILIMEFFDNTLKNAKVASKKLNIPYLGIMPKLFVTQRPLDFEKIQDRLLEYILKNINHFFKTQPTTNKVKTIVVLSTRENEGKTVMAGNIARKLKRMGKSVTLLNHALNDKRISVSKKYTFINKFLGYQNPQCDFSQPFLSKVTDYLNANEYKKYELDSSFINAKNFKELTVHTEATSIQSEYVIIELPNISDHNYPVDLIESADLTILVCRSNRLWSEADDNLLNNIKELAPSKLQFIINGTELNEVESILGELPKVRSNTRRQLKRIFQFQFYSNSHI
ncbi:hypothetical protein [Algibacter mikhailovii]|uniref:hypothetical protein n=1 Tax=Algibacter mikhailovii TaxID=425498 RepID=UPI0024940B3F|nr:hypothetical protein [Algibacter mikhailovii]